MRKGAVVAIIIIAVLVIGGIVGFVIYNSSQNSSTESGTSTGYSQMTGAGLGFEEDQSGVVKQVTEGVAIPGWDKLTIDAGTTTAYVDFYNPEANEGKYYMTYELYLTDTGEKLAETQLIKPGDHVKVITLSRPLEAGTYNAYVHVQPYNADTLVATNNADMKFTLIVK